MGTKHLEPEWHLAAAFEHELGRLLHHPRREIQRLRREAEEGETGATIAIVLTAIGIGATLAVTVILLVVWLSAGGL